MDKLKGVQCVGQLSAHSEPCSKSVRHMECPQCKVFYIGRTKRCLQDRLAEHKYAIQVGNEDYPMARHYKFLHYDNPASLQAMGIDHVPASIRKGDHLQHLNQRERFWIYKLQVTKYPGLRVAIGPFAVI
jgi:hypothetical protein